MNILINCPSKFDINNKNKDFLGGIESLNLHLANNLVKKKHKVILSTLCKKKFKKKKLLNLPVSEVKKNYNKFNFDIIISSNDAKIFNYFPDSKKIFWLHNQLQIEKSIRKLQFLPLLKNRPNVVFVSNYLHNNTSKLYLFNKKYIIPNFLLPSFITKKINFKRKPIFVWSVQRTKGLDKTIDCWINLINPFHKNAKFYIFGVTKLPPSYNRKFLLRKNIYFIGRIEKKKLKNIYSKSMGMICLGYDETFCLNALEANATGLPVVTFGKTALNELISNNKNGFIVHSYDELARKINKIITLNTAKRTQLINNTTKFSKKYNLSIIIKKWDNLLN